MVSAILVRTDDDLTEFYGWLLFRTKEEKVNGNDNYARIYRELAEGVKKELDISLYR